MEEWVSDQYLVPSAWRVEREKKNDSTFGSEYWKRAHTLNFHIPLNRSRGWDDTWYISFLLLVQPIALKETPLKEEWKKKQIYMMENFLISSTSSFI
jgi:hypothetical protein